MRTPARALVVAAVAILFLAAPPAPPSAAGEHGDAGSTEATEATIVTYDDPVALRQAMADDLRAADPAARQLDDHTAVAELTAAEVARVAADPAVAGIEPDGPVYPAEEPDDPCYTTPGACGTYGAWHLRRTDLPAAWNLSHADGAVIAVLDSGIEQSAPIVELQGQLAGELTPAGAGPACTTSDVPPVAHHGTEVASVAAARPSNQYGTAGTGWGARILSVRVFERGPSSTCVGSTSVLIEGIDLAVQAGVEVINLSLTVKSDSPALRAAIGRALAAGIPVVAAAGNSSSSDPTVGTGGYPAYWPEVIAVGATTRNPAAATDPRDPRASFSNYGSWVDIYAPGDDVPAFDRNGSLVLARGTSFAAPVVSGIVAVLRTVAPWATPAEIAGTLGAGGTPLLDDPSARSIDAYGALVAAPAADHFLRGTATPGAPDRFLAYGIGAYRFLLCDFDGDGRDGIVAFDRGNWYVRGSASAGPAESVFAYGAAGYQPVCGDWDGLGGDGIGVYVNGNWFLRQTPSAGPPELAYAYGTTGYQPVVGNWDGLGGDGTGVYVNGNWYLRQTPSAGPPELAYAYGTTGYQPVVGNWDGLGGDGTGVYVDGNWYLRETATPGPPARSFAYGFPGALPLVGASTTPGVDGAGITLR